MNKAALLIGVSEYNSESGLKPLPSAAEDVLAMKRVLLSGEFAAENITVLSNPKKDEMEGAIYQLCANQQKEDLLLFYFSGHGIKDETGRLYFSLSTTRKDQKDKLIKYTAVPATVLHESLNGSSSKCQVVVLDCCFSGAVAKGWEIKAGAGINEIDIRGQLGGKGRVVFASSNSIEYSFYREDLKLSVYTNFFVEGLETGAADLDSDGRISVNEMHEYVSNKVQQAAPQMSPQLFTFLEKGENIYLAHSKKDDPNFKYRREVEKKVEQGSFDVDLDSFSTTARSALDLLISNLGITKDTAKNIETDVTKPKQEHKRKLEDYKKAFQDALEEEPYPFKEARQKDLDHIQFLLGLSNEDVEKIEAEFLKEKRANLRGLIVFLTQLKTNITIRNIDAVAGVFVLSIAIIAIYWNKHRGDSPPSPNLEKQISAGEISFTKEKECSKQDKQTEFWNLKSKGIDLIKNAQSFSDSKDIEKAKKTYQEAATTLIDALRACSNSPKAIEINKPEAINSEAAETRIYFNNALVGAQIGNNQAYTIAVAAPLTSNGTYGVNGLANIRGVAQRQAEINKKRIKGNFLKILLVDDQNNQQDAIELVPKLANKKIYGVIGHQTSGIMMAVKQKYQDIELPVISPSATADEFSHSAKVQYAFRTVTKIEVMAKRLYKRIVDEEKINKSDVAIVFSSDDSSNSAYSLSFKNALIKVGLNQDKLGEAYDLSQHTAEEIISQVKVDKIKAIVIVVSVTGDNKLLAKLNKFSENIAKDNEVQQLKLFGGNAVLNQEFFQNLLKPAQVNQSKKYMELVSPWAEWVGVKAEVSRINPAFWDKGTNWFNVMAYDATSAFIKAIESATLTGDIQKDRKAIQEKLASSDFTVSGAFQDFKFTGTGDRWNIAPEGEPQAYLSKVYYCDNLLGYCYKQADSINRNP
ncbi:MAG: caspase family protein [Nostoc sp.]|uniref:caspase, EACC1-associated type n=1 Tax=Nostoc sp. TaxID=1180 RepID=UPI002FF7375C